VCRIGVGVSDGDDLAMLAYNVSVLAQCMSFKSPVTWPVKVDDAFHCEQYSELASNHPSVLSGRFLENHQRDTVY
jgi:hypothetical protein